VGEHGAPLLTDWTRAAKHFDAACAIASDKGTPDLAAKKSAVQAVHANERSI
jgi:hypothetical protein